MLAPLLEAVAAGRGALGRPMDLPAFTSGLLDGFAPAMTHSLDDYVEGQVHGPLRLEADVEAVVIDPSFAGTPTGELLLAAAARHGFAAEWHEGRALEPSGVPAEAPEPAVWRWQMLCAGGRARRLAERVAGHGRLDAAAIGRAAADLHRHPERWRDWGTPVEVHTHLKDLWRILAAHGHPG